MGDQQSPINLRDPITAPGLSGEVEVDWREDRFVASDEDDGWRFRPCSDHRVRLGDASFRLRNVHFHRPSEHWVAGERLGAEMHAVHVRADDVVRVCVVAVFLELGDPCEAEVPVDGSDGEPPTSIDLPALLPQGGFYRYEGSLTTGEFSENVSWVVMRTPVRVRDEQLRTFLIGNSDPSRDPRPLNRRFVLTTD